MQTELRPCHHLAKLLQRAESARQGDERIAQVGHERLALVHRADYMQLRESPVPDLPRHKVFRDDSLRLAARLKHGVRDSSHQAHIAAAIHQTNVSSRQLRSHLLSGIAVLWTATGAGAAENADSSHAPILSRN